jgi:hypothetical protein
LVAFRSVSIWVFNRSYKVVQCVHMLMTRIIISITYKSTVSIFGKVK